jgi:insertion element IS1 protein InsB
VTFVDRATRCVVNWSVCWEPNGDLVDQMLAESSHGRWYYSDANLIYEGRGYYPGHHTGLRDKSETYSVEGNNAELRHYLARLVRKSRCFSRCIEALRKAVRLFVYYWNQRQLYRRANPGYPSQIIDFVCPLC